MCLRKWYKSVKLKSFFNSCSNIKSISQFCFNFCHFFRCQGCEDVIYQQWISTDRTKLTTISESKEDFVDNFSSQLLKLILHSFTTKSQSAYMKDLKLSMKPLEEIILQGDFAENYSYVVHQSFHWENKQATLHPFVAYHTLDDEDGTLEHRNICVFSDIKEHSTLTVCTFQQVAIGYIKEFPEVKKLKKVHYFTDSCAGQYTNKHSFINLCNYQKDFGLEAE